MESGEEETIAQLIINAVGDADEKTYLGGSLGLQMLISMRRNREKEGVKEVVHFDTETDKRIREFKQDELKGDFAWMDYESWNQLNKSFQEVFIHALEPLFMSAVYFQYSKLIENESKIWPHLPQGVSVYELSDGGNHQYSCVSAGGAIYDWMNELDFRIRKKEFNNRLLRAIGVGEYGLVIKTMRKSQ